MKEWFINNWGFLTTVVKSSTLLILGVLLKFIWDFATFKRDEKMFYSNEFLKLQAMKVNNFIEKLAFFHKILIELQFTSLKSEPIDITTFKQKLLSSLVDLDNTLVELAFFVNDKRYNALRNNFQSILNSIPEIAVTIGDVVINGYTDVNKNNFQTIINNFDLNLYSIKKNLSEIMPGEYHFSKCKTFFKVTNENASKCREYIERFMKK